MNKNEWLVVEGAKVCSSQNPQLAKFLMSALGENVGGKISYWNKYAVDEERGYEKDTKILKWRAPNDMARILSPYLKDGQEILDIGCGSGLVKEAFANYGQVTDLVFDGVDFSQQMLEKAKVRGYRKVACADIAQRDLAMAVWEDFGEVKRYSALVSVGVYGDFVHQGDLSSAFDLADEHSVVGVAGRTADLVRVPQIMKRFGFEVVHQEQKVAHLIYAFKTFVPDLVLSKDIDPKILADAEL